MLPPYWKHHQAMVAVLEPPNAVLVPLMSVTTNCGAVAATTTEPTPIPAAPPEPTTDARQSAPALIFGSVMLIVAGALMASVPGTTCTKPLAPPVPEGKAGPLTVTLALPDEPALNTPAASWLRQDSS